MTKKTGDKLYRLNIEDQNIQNEIKNIADLERDIQNIVN